MGSPDKRAPRLAELQKRSCIQVSFQSTHPRHFLKAVLPYPYLSAAGDMNWRNSRASLLLLLTNKIKLLTSVKRPHVVWLQVDILLQGSGCQTKGLASTNEIFLSCDLSKAVVVWLVENHFVLLACEIGPTSWPEVRFWTSASATPQKKIPWNASWVRGVKQFFWCLPSGPFSNPAVTGFGHDKGGKSSGSEFPAEDELATGYSLRQSILFRLTISSGATHSGGATRFDVGLCPAMVPFKELSLLFFLGGCFFTNLSFFGQFFPTNGAMPR